MAAVDMFRTMVGAMIAQGFAVDSVRDGLDLKGVSEVWGGPETDDHPAWYFWLTSSRGAYRLRLEQTDRMRDCPTPAVRGVFSVKYYPSPGDPVFRHFSEQERGLIEGPLFDHTNTPRFDAQALIPEPLFNVGAIGCIRDLAAGQVFLEFTSIDRLRFFRPPGPAAGSRSHAEDDGNGASPFRQMPAWDVGYPLFDAFVGLQAFHDHRPPKRIILSRQDGFEFVAAGSGGDDLRDSRSATVKSLLVAFLPENGTASSPVEAIMIARQVEDPWTPLVDTAAPWLACHGHQHNVALHQHFCGVDRTCGCARDYWHDGPHDHRPSTRGQDAFLHPVQVGNVTWEVPLAFNALWWALTASERTVNAMPCGCH